MQPQGVQHQIVLYTRPGCGLCEHAKVALAAVRAEISFDYREVDIDSDPALYELHKHDIPVIEIDGRRAFKHRIAPDELRERLLR